MTDNSDTGHARSADIEFQATPQPLAVVSDLPIELPDVLSAIVTERRRQVARWGDQSDLPDADPLVLSRVGDQKYGEAARPERVAQALARYYEVPSEARARQSLTAEVGEHGGTWFGIALEEVCEALDVIPQAVADDDPAELIAEVEQCAAVFTAWSEALRRRGVKRTVRR